VRLGQRLEASVIAGIARQITFSAYVYNGSGAAFQPSLLLGTPSVSDNFGTVTNRLTQTLQSCANAAWTLVSNTVDISAYTNLANGLQVELQIPSGSLVSGDTIRIAEPMLCEGAIVSPFDVEPIAVTQERCGRFYEQGAHLFNGAVTSGSTYSVRTTWRWQKRIAPNITLTNAAATNFPTTGTATGATVFYFDEQRVANGTGGGLFSTTFIAECRL
jgi:hypothetical protein